MPSLSLRREAADPRCTLIKRCEAIPFERMRYYRRVRLWHGWITTISVNTGIDTAACMSQHFARAASAGVAAEARCNVEFALTRRHARGRKSVGFNSWRNHLCRRPNAPRS